MKQPLGVSLLGCLLAFILCSRSTASDPNLLKRVSAGLVQGAWEDLKQQGIDSLYAGSKVAVWKSIPYGQAPIARLRWRAPRPAPQWSGTLDGSVYRPPCIQPDGSGSEDCLHVHVTAPPGALNATVRLLPVLVYIHGGGLMDGSGMYEYMSAFALHANVVVVAINYRLGIFGWLALDGLRDADGSVGNYGLRDQQLALAWARSNVRVFGGDPGRLTVAGQSSGGTSIFALYSSPFSIGLFDRAISLSGSINISMGTSQAFSQNQVIADLLQCAGVSTSECLRNTSVQQLVLAQHNSSWGRTPGIFGLDKTTPKGLSPSKDWFGASMNTPAAAVRVMRPCESCVCVGIPVVDGVSIVQSFSDSLRAAVVDVPLIISSMGQECDLAPDTDTHNISPAEWLQILNSTFNQQPWSDGSDVAAAYANDSEVDPALAYASINADYSLSCGNIAIATAAKLAAFKSPIYVILNQWHPEHTAAQVRPRWAFHTFDYGAAFEQWDDMRITPTEQDLQFGRLMRELMAAFIYGNTSTLGVRTIDSDHDFPSSYVVNVVEIGSGSAAVVGYKAEQCSMWTRMGLDERFWWID